jgi:bifunctional enzyme CysN/CysC
VWFTGLSGAGKSTLAAAVEERLVRSGRPAYRLDGDNVRSGLNSDLGFTPEGREENVRRVGQVALLFADAGLIALVALISPYAKGRARARALHENAGIRFVEVYVATPLAVCAGRDPKGLYARASAGELASLTGVDAQYEPPDDPELVVSHEMPLSAAVEGVLELVDPR